MKCWMTSTALVKTPQVTNRGKNNVPLDTVKCLQKRGNWRKYNPFCAWNTILTWTGFYYNHSSNHRISFSDKESCHLPTKKTERWEGERNSKYQDYRIKAAGWSKGIIKVKVRNVLTSGSTYLHRSKAENQVPPKQSLLHGGLSDLQQSTFLSASLLGKIKSKPRLPEPIAPHLILRPGDEVTARRVKRVPFAYILHSIFHYLSFHSTLTL